MKRIVNALDTTDIMLIQKATRVTSPRARKENIRPINKKSGAPGGCGTCNLYAQAMNSPQSQKDAVGSTVKVYVTSEIRKTIQPTRLLLR